MVWTEAVSDAAVYVHRSFCGEGSREKLICSSLGPNDNFIWQCGDNGTSGRSLGGRAARRNSLRRAPLRRHESTFRAHLPNTSRNSAEMAPR
eukprot:549544-Pyramimonas_sp.AAC.1